MLRILLFIFFLMNCSLLFSQVDILKNGPINFEKKDKKIMEREYNLLLTHDLDSIPDKDEWIYYLYKSILQFYLSKDSSFINLDNAFIKNPKAVCRVILNVEKTYMYRMEKGNIDSDHSWFFWDIPPYEQAKFRKKCEGIVFPRKERNDRRKTVIETFIMENDQSERKKSKTDWTIMNALDLKNRLFLDSLYETHGSFAPFNKYEQDAFSFVLHHSDDCEWNRKWFKIWFDEKMKGNLKGGKLLGQAIVRMLEPGKGVCAVREPELTKEFIKYLKDHYPQDYAEKFGYNSY